MSSGGATFFWRQEREIYLWIMVPMIVTNEVPQRQHGFRSLSAAAASLKAAELAHALPNGRRISVVTDDDSPLIASAPVQWATQKLRDAITPQGIATKGGFSDFSILIAPVDSPLAKAIPNRPNFTQPESTALIPGRNKITLMATRSAARGITYAVL